MEDDDELDLEFLRNAALQSLRKTGPPPPAKAEPYVKQEPPTGGMAQGQMGSMPHMHRGGLMRGNRGRRGMRGNFRGNSHVR